MQIDDIRDVCFQAEDGIRDLVRSRGLGDVYKRQVAGRLHNHLAAGRQEQPGQNVERLLRAADDGHLLLSLIHI